MKILGIIGLLMLVGCGGCPLEIGDRVIRLSDGKQGTVLNNNSPVMLASECSIIVIHDDKSFSFNRVTDGEYVGHYKYQKQAKNP